MREKLELTKFIKALLLSPDDYPELEEPKDYPFETTKEEIESYDELADKIDKWCKENGFKIMDTEILCTDLEKSYQNLKHIFSYKGKYYAFYLTLDSYDGYSSDETTATEVFHHQQVITVYD